MQVICFFLSFLTYVNHVVLILFVEVLIPSRNDAFTEKQYFKEEKQNKQITIVLLP